MIAPALGDDGDYVVLVDASDRELGTLPKLEAHREGRLHRAVSVFVSNKRGEVLLQRRASGKYHSAGLWSNTCCTHPRPGESVARAARRRLREEMGVTCEVRPVFRFVYDAELDRGLIEHEYDHVFLGTFDGEPFPDPREVDAWRWAAPDAIDAELAERPDTFTAWFPIAWHILKELSDSA